jgi:protein disulfide-isomerase
MKFLARITVVACAGITALAAAGDGLTTVTINGETYNQISDVHVSSGGRITILYGLGGRTVKADQLPAGFLDSWGISQKDLDRSAAKTAASGATSYLANQRNILIGQAIDDGLIREADGVVYDLRQLPPDWERFDRVKIYTNSPQGALVDRTPDAAESDFVLVFNLQADSAADRVSFIAKKAGNFNYSAPSGPQTINAYDVGRIYKSGEVPEAMLKLGSVQVELTNRANQIKVQTQARSEAAPKLMQVLEEIQTQVQEARDAAGPWGTTYAQAQAQAAQQNRYVLVYFTGSDWSEPARKMDSEVLSAPEFNDYAGKFLVLVRADFPQKKHQSAAVARANNALKAQFGVNDIPTLVLVKSDGTVITKQEGYLEGGPLALINKFNTAIAGP